MSMLLAGAMMSDQSGGGTISDYVAKYLFNADYTDETGNYNGSNTGSTFVGAGNGPGGSNFGIVTGGTAYVELGSAISAALGSGSGTISFAFKALSSSGDPIVFSGADNATDNNFIAFSLQNTTAKLRVIYNSGNTYTSNSTYSIGVWQHGIIRVNGFSTSFRINGANTTTTVTSGSDTGAWLGDVDSLDHTTIGRIRDLSPFGGASFHVAFLTLYSRSLSDIECAQLEAEY